MRGADLVDTTICKRNHGRSALANLHASKLTWQPTEANFYGQVKPEPTPVNSM